MFSKAVELFNTLLPYRNGDYRLVDQAVMESILKGLTDEDLKDLLVYVEVRLGEEFAHLLQRQPRYPFIDEQKPYLANMKTGQCMVFDTDMIVLEAWCESGENHTTRIKAMHMLWEHTDDIIRQERDRDPYE